MIEIQKQTSKHPEVDEALLEKAIQSTVATLDKPEMDMTLRLTSDAEMRALNQRFRAIAASTDVLSFNQDYVDPETGRLYLGDIVISVDRALQQAPINHHSLDEECAFLAIHGTLHLLGYDHYEPGEKEEMWRLQDAVYERVLSEYEGDKY